MILLQFFAENSTYPGILSLSQLFSFSSEPFPVEFVLRALGVICGIRLRSVWASQALANRLTRRSFQVTFVLVPLFFSSNLATRREGVMRISNRTSVINDIQGCLGNQDIVRCSGTKQTLVRFLEALKLRAAFAATILRDMCMHEARDVVATYAAAVEPTSSTVGRLHRSWHGLRLAPAVVPVR